MPALFDASIYIRALRAGTLSDRSLERWMRESPLWLSSVVLEELYAGADVSGFRVLDRLRGDFEKSQRMLVPNLDDWVRAGRLLAGLARKYGYEQIGRAKLTNDALIAVSAARNGITVVTANRRDFARLAEFCPLQWEAQVFP